MPTVAAGRDPAERLAPSDRFRRQGVQQDAPQIAAKDLRPPARAVVGLLKHDLAAPVEHARGLAARMDNGAKRVDQAGGFQRGLSVRLVNVELAALRARGRRSLGFVDRDGDAVDVQNAGEDKAAEPRANDGDGRSHSSSVALFWNDVP
jgi:hypothetical protein